MPGCHGEGIELPTSLPASDALCTEGELSALTGPGGGQYTFLVTGTQDSVPSAFARLFSSNKMSPPLKNFRRPPGGMPDVDMLLFILLADVFSSELAEAMVVEFKGDMG